MKVSRVTIEDSNQEIVNQDVTRATQKTRSKTRSTPSKQTRENRSTAPCADLPDPRASARLASALDSSAIPSLSSSPPSASASFRTIRKEEALVACSAMWAQQGLKCAPAPSDVDVDLFKLKTTEEKGYEGFICPQCKGALDSPEYLIEHQQFCPGAPAEQTTTPSSKDVCVNL